MTVRRHGDRGVRTTTRRFVTVGVAWTAMAAISMVGCGQPAVTSPPPVTRAVAPVVATAVASPAATAPGPAITKTPASTKAPASTPGPSSRLTPVRVRVPAIGVDAPLVRLGLTSEGALDVPVKAMTAGWYTGSPVPGLVGPAVIAGHVHWSGIPAVFARLTDLRPGDRIVVSRSDGTTATFTVDRVATYPKARFPTALVYDSLDHPGLRLITCGDFDPVTRTYEANVIAFATLVTP